MLKRAVGGVVARRNFRWRWARASSTAEVPKERVECVVIGAGVVGAAVARELSLRGREVLVLDSAPTFATGTSSRNSEVIHAGIYYPPHSLKLSLEDLDAYMPGGQSGRWERAERICEWILGLVATLCARGRDLLYTYCSEHNIPHKQIGKLIVATSTSEIPKLNHIMIRGTENGVPGLHMMEGSEAMRMEPELQCLKAVLSPLTGILDTHSLMLSLVGEAEDNGATFSYNTSVIGGHLEQNRICLHISETKCLENCNGSFPSQPELILIPDLVVNSAGLSAPVLAKRVNGLHDAVIPHAYYARGCYFTLSNMKIPPFKHLIYPIPVEGGIGVHVTLDLDGQVKFGPDVEWI
ncbi:hypothetical protein TIFTF001_036597, partial [Ficus carica]